MMTLHPVTTRGCGCDRTVAVKALVRVGDALALIGDSAKAVTVSEVTATGLAPDRTLSDLAEGLQMTPHFHNSTKDGNTPAFSALTGPGQAAGTRRVSSRTKHRLWPEWPRSRHPRS